MLFSIEPMPKYVVALDASVSDGGVDIVYPESGQRYETLGILDNGIASIPHLAPWMTDKRWTVYPDDVTTPTHGTFVAGVALYGDICEGEDWVGHKGIKLFDATVFPDTTKEGLDETILLPIFAKRLRQIMKELRCGIFPLVSPVKSVILNFQILQLL